MMGCSVVGLLMMWVRGDFGNSVREATMTWMASADARIAENPHPSHNVQLRVCCMKSSVNLYPNILVLVVDNLKIKNNLLCRLS